MSIFNQTNDLTPEENYQNGFLPQRNHKDLWYQDTSSRSDLSIFSLSSENRRVLSRTSNFSFEVIPLNQFNYTPAIQKQISLWLKQLEWDFPMSSVKTVFTQHLFNYLYLWYDSNHDTIAYSLCYFSPTISHIAYVFYNPIYARSNLPIRLVLQAIQDSALKKLKYCYLGRFSPDTGYYKRNMPGFEYFDQGEWKKL